MKLKLSVLFIAVFISLLAAYALSAGESPGESYVTDEVVISANGYGKTLTSTPGGIGVLSSDGIMKRVPVSITDALQDITGVYKSSDSAWGSEISIRGTARDKVIMLIDGSRLNTSTDIGAQFGTINPASITRVEVLKGPISSLYGSGSIGGVVNIYTRTGEFTDDPVFKSGINVSYENNSSGANTYGFTSYNSPVFYIFGSGSWRNHDDYTDGNGDEVANSGFEDAEGVVNLGFKPAPGHTIELRNQYYEGEDIGIPGARDSVPVTASEAEYKKMRRGLVSLDYKITPDSAVWVESKFHMYWMYLKREVRIISSPMKIEPESDNRTTGGQWTNIFVSGDNKVVAGVDSWVRTISTDRTKTNLTTNAVTEDTPVPDAMYWSSGIFAEDDLKKGSFTFNLGGRYDIIYVSNEKSYTSTSALIWDKKEVQDYSWNGHAGVSYEFFKDFSTALLAASGYRAASIEERYKYIALGTVEHWGDPDLDPERSWFFEYSLHYKNSWFKGNASCYLNQLRDLIADEQVSSTVYRLQNIDRARIWGTEYDITLYVLDWLEMYNNLSFTKGRDTKNDEDLPGVAPLRVITGFKITAPYGISGFIDGTWTAAQKDVPDGMDESDSWFRLDGGIDIKFTTGGFDHRVTVTCTNILDKEYYDYMSLSQTGYTFNEPGRSVKCGYSVLF